MVDAADVVGGDAVVVGAAVVGSVVGVVGGAADVAG